jgi:hypothetical protein
MNEPRTRPALVANAFETSGVTVINIHPEEFGVNNRFGAGYAASLMNHQLRQV